MKLENLVEKILAAAASQPRFLVAICGAPTSGKTTLADRLVQRLNLNGNKAVFVGMDGFHLDNCLLRQRRLLATKGAPETFDAEGFVNAISRIKSHEDDIYLPVFDRAIETARAAALVVRSSDRIIIVEGNYLLLRQPPWNRLAALFDLSIFIDVDMVELEQRSLARWRHYGYSEDEAQTKVQHNDLANARYVIENSSAADLVLRHVD